VSAAATRLLAREAVAGGWWLVRLAWEGPAPLAGQYLDATLDGRRLILPARAASHREGWLAGLLEPALGGVLEALAVGVRGTFAVFQPRSLQAALSPEGCVLLGRDNGIGPALAFAEARPEALRFAALGGDQGVPGRVQPSRFLSPGLPAEAIGALAGLESLGVVSRVAHPAGRPGCFEGQPEDLLARYVERLGLGEAQGLEVVAFGPPGTEQTLQRRLAGRIGALRTVELPA